MVYQQQQIWSFPRKKPVIWETSKWQAPFPWVVTAPATHSVWKMRARASANSPPTETNPRGKNNIYRSQ